MADAETVWTETEFVGHDFRDDDLSRLRTERAVFTECDFSGVDMSESKWTELGKHPSTGRTAEDRRKSAKKAAATRKERGRHQQHK